MLASCAHVHAGNSNDPGTAQHAREPAGDDVGVIEGIVLAGQWYDFPWHAPPEP